MHPAKVINGVDKQLFVELGGLTRRTGGRNERHQITPVIEDKMGRLSYLRRERGIEQAVLWRSQVGVSAISDQISVESEFHFVAVDSSSRDSP
jgi:hypothetical protein